jgi:AcrR family transcriptional regulator
LLLYRPDGIVRDVSETRIHSTKRRLLAAAARVVHRYGVGALTLEAVAAEAGLSKGGLLYHYPDKAALIAALVRFYMDSFERQIERRAGESTGAGSWTGAYIDVSLEEAGSERDMNAGLLAALMLNPELLEPVRERYATWQARAVSDGIDPALALMLQLAADGLWLGEMLGLVELEAGQRERVREKMLELARDGAG